MSVVVRQGEMRIERARRLMNERSGFCLVAWLVKDWFWGIGESRRNGERPGWWEIEISREFLLLLCQMGIARFQEAKSGIFREYADSERKASRETFGRASDERKMKME